MKLRSILAIALFPLALSPWLPEAHAQAGGGFQLSSTDDRGSTVRLSDYAGKTVWIGFVATGCNLCNYDLKLIRDFYASNKRRGFVAIAVNVDRDWRDFEAYRELVAHTQPSDKRFPLLWRGAAGHQDNFGPISLPPTSFLINAKGTLIWRREGAMRPEEWDALMTAIGLE